MIAFLGDEQRSGAHSDEHQLHWWSLFSDKSNWMADQ